MHILENARVWNFFRKSLDRTAGLYRRREAMIRDFGIGRAVSVLDVGCGSGQYSGITEGEYLGIDMDPRYIESARRVYGTAKRNFECIPLQQAVLRNKRFDVSLLIDLTHHVNDGDLDSLLGHLASVTKKALVITDPVRQCRRNYWGRFLTSLDRGEFIRPKVDELKRIGKYFEILKVADSRFLGVENIMVFARPLTMAS